MPSPLSEPRDYLEDVLSGRDRWVLRAFVTAWLASVAVFGVWWFEPEHWTTLPGMVLNTVPVGLATLTPSWFYLVAGRMKRPRADLPFPDLRTAMIVTRAPSEPWPLVRTTLLAMLRQDFPGGYDVWLADEAPTAEIRAWCAEHGVRISCRQGVEDYHRPTWPRRTRCKEGNLAYFYDHHGYRDYDVVAQFDADHAPGPGYLRRVVEPFACRRVGYVAAPSICDRNAAASWSARGRLYLEAALHGPGQAGCSGGFAPLCIGSHYAVRTAALREIGGLGPELAEDFTTTLMMSAHGWQGVFALDAEAHGDGPGCFADAATQHGPRQPEYSLASIVSGRHDAYIQRWAERLRAYGGPLRIRFAQEMNGTWYPWAAGSNSEGANGNRPGEYVAAWRHVHDIFRAAGADNARWVWSPLVGGIGRAVYPGDAYVDLVGLSGFNGGAALPSWGGWRSFQEIFGPSIRQLRGITSKPIVIAETGSTARGGDRAGWIGEMFAYLKRQPDVTSVTWFDVDKEADWSLDGSPECLAAIGQSLSDPGTRRQQLRDWMHR